MFIEFIEMMANTGLAPSGAASVAGKMRLLTELEICPRKSLSVLRSYGAGKLCRYLGMKSTGAAECAVCVSITETTKTQPHFRIILPGI